MLVLLVFVYLVTCHIGKLYGPGDFQDEENFLKAAALLGAAAANRNAATSDAMGRVVESIQVAASTRARPRGATSKRQVLWVDDRPSNNEYERQALEAVGLRFTLAESTEEALAEMQRSGYVAVISDMGRREGPREGYVLLDKLRERGDRTPLFFYASSNSSEHKREAYEHGGQGCTNSPQELFDMVIGAVFGQQSG
ncbi:MAG: response regulator [Rhodospirillaceae bacterium]|nr:response regulator [Rhodospirillaceae bacterium]